MVKRSSSKGPLAGKIALALEHGSASITSRQVVEYIQAFKSQYPDSDIELAQPMIMARGYGDDPGLDYVHSWWMRTCSRTMTSCSPIGGARTRFGRTTVHRAGQRHSAVPAARTRSRQTEVRSN